VLWSTFYQSESQAFVHENLISKCQLKIQDQQSAFTMNAFLAAATADGLLKYNQLARTTKHPQAPKRYTSGKCSGKNETQH
jgi:hypothetical protein